MVNDAAESGRRFDVMVTGGTGFVGLHTVLALVEAGHGVRLLVRNPDKMKRVFEPWGLAGLPTVEGDITDEAAVERALDGCDAVVHSAAIVSVQTRDSERILENNLLGTRLVLGGAAKRGIERMVQVSSTTALFRSGAEHVDEASPLGSARTGYGRSKIECDRLVRGLQEQGVPIYTTYPGTVIGPDDPGMTGGMFGLKSLVDSGSVMETTGGIQLIDVRDLARAHVGLLERGGPPDRYLMGGHFLEWSAYADLLEDIIGKPIWRIPTPRAVYHLAGRVGELLSRFAPFDVPLTAESMHYVTDWVETDDRHIKETLGMEYRDVRKTLYDAIFWLQGAGHLWRRYRLVAR